MSHKLDPNDDAYPDLNSAEEAGAWAMRQFRSGRTIVKFQDIRRFMNSELDPPLAAFAFIDAITRITNPDSHSVIGIFGGAVSLTLYKAPRYGLN